MIFWSIWDFEHDWIVIFGSDCGCCRTFDYFKFHGFCWDAFCSQDCYCFLVGPLVLPSWRDLQGSLRLVLVGKTDRLK